MHIIYQNQPMKNSELRIGNLIQCIPSMRKSQDENDYGTIGRVLEIGNDEREFEQIYCECSESFEWFFKDEYCGIPLSEKLLIIFGFVKSNHSNYDYVDKKTGTIRLCERDGYYKLEVGRGELFGKQFKYIHHLQNLYFILTGEELINWEEIDISEIIKQIEE